MYTRSQKECLVASQIVSFAGDGRRARPKSGDSSVHVYGNSERIAEYCGEHTLDY